nr:ribosome silencing factor [Oceanicola sp. S124]
MSLDATADLSASEGAQVMAAPQELSVDDQLALILQSLEDDKAEEIVQIDLAGKSSIGDYMVVCSGRSSRQVGALAEKLVERLKEATGRTAKVEGKEAGDWVLIDTGDVIVHVFRPEVREFYQIEKMWMQPGQKTTVS